MKIGLVDVDRTNFPNLALMKISAFHKSINDEVIWVDPLFGGGFDKVYMSKVFTFTPDYEYPIIADEIEKGGTGYDIRKVLPAMIDRMQPDYSIYGIEDTAYGFLTRGCPNGCKWCIVPLKEGKQVPYMDVEEIAIEGRKKLILMDNNVLASDYGLGQIEKIIKIGYRVDFNQGLDVRLVTDDIAKMLAQVKWLRRIRFACDTSAQIPYIESAYSMLQKHGYRGEIFGYCLLQDFEESFNRINYMRRHKWFIPFAQPFRNFDRPQSPPQWQKDMAHWVNRMWVFRSCEFADFEPRKGFKCNNYFKYESR